MRWIEDPGIHNAVRRTRWSSSPRGTKASRQTLDNWEGYQGRAVPHGNDRLSSSGETSTVKLMDAFYWPTYVAPPL